MKVPKSNVVSIPNRGGGFTKVPNQVLSDSRLSIDARGMLAYLLSFSSDWNFRPNRIMCECGVGKDKYYRIVRELIDIGYLKSVPGRGANGRFSQTEWLINDEMPHLENPHAVNPASGKTGHLRRTTYKKNNNKKPHTPKGDLSDYEKDAEKKEEPSRFSEFWDAYPNCQRKVGKSKAKKAFDQIVTGKHKQINQTAANVVIRGVKAFAVSGTDPQYIPLPKTWLNDERWEVFQNVESARRRGSLPDWEEIVL